VRLLCLGLPLTIALGTVAAAVAFPALPIAVALLIGSALAPTDAALGQRVITDPAVPVRIRRLLNVESGLNDGIATPFVLLALAFAAQPDGGAAFEGAIRAFAMAAVAGGVLGGLGALALVAADGRRWTSSLSRQLAALAIAATCYLGSVSLDGNGFIGAFVGGLAFGRASRYAEEGALELTEQVAGLLAIGVWLAFGLTGASLLLPISPTPIVYALLSLTVIRLLPVAVALLGSGFQVRTVAFIGWFGPRGLASVVFLVIGLDGLGAAGVDAGAFTSAVAWTVLLSVVLHGFTSGPLARRFGLWSQRLPEDSVERARVDELPGGWRSLAAR
jgi:NhaP-type Na+/H+ or K+/H+ antiporter